MVKVLREVETELTHSYNMLDLATSEIEEVLESNDIAKLSKVLSVITKANDTILEQLDELTDLTVKKTA